MALRIAWAHFSMPNCTGSSPRNAGCRAALRAEFHSPQLGRGDDELDELPGFLGIPGTRGNGEAVGPQSDYPLSRTGGHQGDVPVIRHRVTEELQVEDVRHVHCQLALLEQVVAVGPDAGSDLIFVNHVDEE